MPHGNNFTRKLYIYKSRRKDLFKIQIYMDLTSVSIKVFHRIVGNSVGNVKNFVLEHPKFDKKKCIKWSLKTSNVGGKYVLAVSFIFNIVIQFVNNFLSETVNLTNSDSLFVKEFIDLLNDELQDNRSFHY